jgi:hypothetical protein
MYSEHSGTQFFLICTDTLLRCTILIGQQIVFNIKKLKVNGLLPSCNVGVRYALPKQKKNLRMSPCNVDQFCFTPLCWLFADVVENFFFFGECDNALLLTW